MKRNLLHLRRDDFGVGFLAWDDPEYDGTLVHSAYSTASSREDLVFYLASMSVVCIAGRTVGGRGSYRLHTGRGRHFVHIVVDVTFHRDGRAAPPLVLGVEAEVLW